MKSGNSYLKLLGARILSELNDIKRTPEAAAEELGLTQEFMDGVLSGEKEIEDSLKLIRLMGDSYPIDESDLYLVPNDTVHGVKIMRASDSKKSRRIFDRPNKDGIRTPYYDYRDTAMSKLAAFKPEWIQELRVVSDSDPENPDVVYNNGHFMHQMTFFIGPVNFYYEINGKKYCREMNTGDSNYITPFFRHSFTNRNKDEFALIVAVTFGGNVRRAQKEIYSLGNKSSSYMLDFRNTNKAISQLIKQHIRNENFTEKSLLKQLNSIGIDIDLKLLLDENEPKNLTDLKKLADFLNVEVSDMLIPTYKPDEDVVIRHKKENEASFYPNDDLKLYRIFRLARSSKMPLLKGFSVDVLTDTPDLENGFESSLHQYIYNYGEEDAHFHWISEDQIITDTLKAGDSAYVQPFVKYAFGCTSEKEARIFTVGISGAIDLATQKELSYFSSMERVIYETKKWFN